jgi:MFS family permease
MTIPSEKSLEPGSQAGAGAGTEPQEAAGARTRLDAGVEALDGMAGKMGPLAGTARGMVRVVAVFARPYFASLWFGMLLSNIGTWVYVVSVQWKVHEVKEDPRWLGYCVSATWCASIVTTPVGGVIADRMDCRKIMIVINVFLLVMSAVMAVLSWQHLMTGPVFICASIMAGICNAMYAPASQTLIPRIVGQEHVSNAVALNAMQFNTSRAIGPAIGGWILGIWGATVGFWVNSLSFLAPVVSLLSLPKGLGVSRTTTHAHPVRSILEGLKYARERMDVRLVLGTVFVAAFCISPTMSLIPAYVKECYDNKPEQYSAMLTMFGLGAIVGVPLVASRVKGSPNPWLGPPLLVGFGLVNFGLGMAPAFVVTRVLAFAGGLCFIGAMNRMLSFLVTGTPGELRGRVISLHFLVFSLGLPLGSMLYGQMAGAWGMRAVFFVNGGVLVVMMGVMLFLARGEIKKGLGSKV